MKYPGNCYRLVILSLSRPGAPDVFYRLLTTCGAGLLTSSPPGTDSLRRALRSLSVDPRSALQSLSAALPQSLPVSSPEIVAARLSSPVGSILPLAARFCGAL